MLVTVDNAERSPQTPSTKNHFGTVIPYTSRSCSDVHEQREAILHGQRSRHRAQVSTQLSVYQRSDFNLLSDSNSWVYLPYGPYTWIGQRAGNPEISPAFSQHVVLNMIKRPYLGKGLSAIDR